MKFQITMQDPDGVFEGIRDAVDESLKSNPPWLGETEDDLREIRTTGLNELCGKWFEYGEYLTIEIDTAKKTARIVPVGEEE